MTKTNMYKTNKQMLEKHTDHSLFPKRVNHNEAPRSIKLQEDIFNGFMSSTDTISSQNCFLQGSKGNN